MQTELNWPEEGEKKGSPPGNHLPGLELSPFRADAPLLLSPWQDGAEAQGTKHREMCSSAPAGRAEKHRRGFMVGVVGLQA